MFIFNVWSLIVVHILCEHFARVGHSAVCLSVQRCIRKLNSGGAKRDLSGTQDTHNTEIKSAGDICMQNKTSKFMQTLFHVFYRKLLKLRLCRLAFDVWRPSLCFLHFAFLYVGSGHVRRVFGRELLTLSVTILFRCCVSRLPSSWRNRADVYLALGLLFG